EHEFGRVVVDETHQALRGAARSKREPVKLCGSPARAVRHVTCRDRHRRGLEATDATALGMCVDIGAGECDDLQSLVPARVCRDRVLLPFTLEGGQLDITLLEHGV